MKIFLSLFFTSALLLAMTDFEEVYEVYQTGNFQYSFKEFQILAEEHNDLDAAYILAYMYEHGEGCEVDMEKANEWYRISSKGYYHLVQDITTRDIDKSKRKLYNSLEKSGDTETEETMRQFTQSLYSIKAHGTNYFLPVSYRYNGKYADTNGHEAKGIETEFQLSLKYDFSTNLLGFHEIYTAAYTQVAFWQLYAESAYFRELNYNPELFVTFPVMSFIKNVPLKALRFSFEHQSNGRGGEEERSWNYLSLSSYFQFKSLFTELKLWHRLPDNIDYNPNLLDYLGHGHIRFMFPYKKHMTKLLLRATFSGESAVEVNYSYPISGSDDLYLYIKGFSGYGESLIDYDKNVNKVGIGFSISR